MPEETGVPDLYTLAFIPGCFRCPKCGCQLSKVCINSELGLIGTREEDRESEPCPNDATMMVHVTYREQLVVYAQRLKEEFERFDSHTKAVGVFLGEMFAIMVDPLDDSVIKPGAVMAILKQAAIDAREREFRQSEIIGLLMD